MLVAADPLDEGARVPAPVMGVRYCFDDERRIAALFGVTHAEKDGGYRPTTFIIDERLRAFAVVSVRDAATHASQVYALLDRLAPRPAAKPPELQAPVIVVPRVFERVFCAALIEGYRAYGGDDSGSWSIACGDTGDPGQPLRLCALPVR